MSKKTKKPTTSTKSNQSILLPVIAGVVLFAAIFYASTSVSTASITGLVAGFAGARIPGGVPQFNAPNSSGNGLPTPVQTGGPTVSSLLTGVINQISEAATYNDASAILTLSQNTTRSSLFRMPARFSGTYPSVSDPIMQLELRFLEPNYYYVRCMSQTCFIGSMRAGDAFLFDGINAYRNDGANHTFYSCSNSDNMRNLVNGSSTSLLRNFSTMFLSNIPVSAGNNSYYDRTVLYRGISRVNGVNAYVLTIVTSYLYGGQRIEIGKDMLYLRQSDLLPIKLSSSYNSDAPGIYATFYDQNGSKHNIGSLVQTKVVSSYELTNLVLNNGFNASQFTPQNLFAGSTQVASQPC